MTASTDAAGSPQARRVLAFIGGFIPGHKYSGPIRSMVDLLESLPESVKVTLVTADRDLGDSVPYPGLSGRVVHRGPHEVYYVNWRDPRHWMALLRWARRNPIDLIYINSLWSPAFTVLPIVAHRLGLLRSPKVLLAPRGELSTGSLGIKSAKKQAFLHGWAPLLRRIDPVWHAATEMEQTDIHRVFPWARTVVQIDSRGDEPRMEIIGSRERARFVFISRIMETKNLLLALQSLHLVKAEVDFDIYGPVEDVQYWRQCQHLIADLPKNVKASYLGELRHDQVTDTFAVYDAFVLPTRGESFGHVISESLSSGCPVICSQRTPWTRVLSQGGGAALRDLDVVTLSEELQKWAKHTPLERDAAKRDALNAFAEWRVGQGGATAVERTLDGMLGTTQPERRGNAPRIALVTQSYQSDGGVQTVARWLVKGLLGAGFEVEIFDLAASRVDSHSRRLVSPVSWLRSSLLVSDPSDIRVTHVGANAVEFEPLRYLPRAELSTELHRFDLVQVVAGAPAPVLAAVGGRRPVVLQVATTVARERAPHFTERYTPVAIWRGGMTKVVSVMERVALQRADAVLVENREMLDFVHSISQTHVVLAPPGVDTTLFAPPGRGWDPSGFLLSLCRLNDARKGLERLIRSYALMADQRPSVPHLVLAGRGDLPAHVHRLIAELGLTGQVNVRRDVPQSELPSLYRGASVYLQASYEEGLGISVLEAMASGLPVVSTDTAGTQETVVHGKTGWLISQESDMEVTMATRTLAVLDSDGSTMSVLARLRADSVFSDQVTLSRFLDVYDQLIGSDRGRGRSQ
jgi:glycosyltransferase involved in cell wall biosynthesis